MKILGISAYYHDSAAAIVIDGEVKAAVAEERLSRVKHDNSFPILACDWCLKYCGITLEDIDAVVFYEKPFLKFERIIENVIHNAPKSIGRYLKAVPEWIGGKLNMRNLIKSQLKNLNMGLPKEILFVEHHLAHAAFGYFTSGLSNAAVLVADAVGEFATTSFFKAEGKELILIKEQHYPNSLGLLYSAFTQFLGFRVNSDEYKVMGLAPYGDGSSPETLKFIETIKGKLATVYSDGSIKLCMQYFNFDCHQRMINISKWERLFETPYRKPGSVISQPHKNLAFAIQYVINEIGLSLSASLKDETGLSNLVISGGCALNCVMNGIIKNRGQFENVFVPVDPGDAGCAIGAALAVESKSKCITPYQGPAYDDNTIKGAIENSGFAYEPVSETDLIQKVAMHISQGKIVGWFQGRAEFGPRALGNRSIFADCRNPETKNRINTMVKFRETFRPFAPVVCHEYATQYFGINSSPYMMFATEVKTKDVPAITHIDNTARPQTVSFEENSLLYRLICTYGKITGIPVILNTSFNVMGEPMVCSPSDALNTFRDSGIDVLAIGNFIVTKK